MNRSEMAAELPFRVVIPARYGSTRLPGKPLRMLAGKPLIEHVYHRAQASGAEEVIIATDDRRIGQMAEGFGATVCMTAVDHPSGTDRLAEVARVRGWADDAIIVNLQGDEPLMPPTLIDQVAADLHHHQDAGMATLCVRIHHVHEIFDPHLVKVVRDAHGYALFFSRAPIPYHRDRFCRTGKSLSEVPEDCDYFRHIGLYAYRACVLRRFPQLSPCMLERTESLEQLRALWHGIRIHVQEALEIPQAGVDTEQDLARVMAFLADA
jgi:3-deoxy-manno-octulosonate cytidylyltransferase (CMP-KDO synthetase)